MVESGSTLLRAIPPPGRPNIDIARKRPSIFTVRNRTAGASVEQIQQGTTPEDAAREDRETADGS